MKIELLYFPGCPNYEPALKRLEKVLREESIYESVDQVCVESDVMALKLKFPGSPTIRVDGDDVEGKSGQYEFNNSCRIYQENGVTAGIPPENLIRQALRKGT